MRNKLFLAVAAAFSLSSVCAAYAAPSFPDVKKADETKNPTSADVNLAKVEAKDAKKKAHLAKSKAKTAEHKADAAAKAADKAADAVK